MTSLIAGFSNSADYSCTLNEVFSKEVGGAAAAAAGSEGEGGLWEGRGKDGCWGVGI